MDTNTDHLTGYCDAYTCYCRPDADRSPNCDGHTDAKQYTHYVGDDCPGGHDKHAKRYARADAKPDAIGVTDSYGNRIITGFKLSRPDPR